MRRLLRTVTALIIATGIAVAGGTDARAVTAGAGAAAPAACTGTVQITSLGFSPTAIAPGQSSAAGLTVQNCTTQAQQTTTRWVARFVGPGAGIPPGCPGIDPLVRPANLPAGGQLSLTTTYLAFQTCTATSLQLTVQVIGSTGNVLATQTANLAIGSSCTPPLPLGSLTVTAVSNTAVSLSWVGPTNAACIAYDVLRAPGSSGGTFTLVGTTSGLSFTDTGLPINTTYRYLVQGRNLSNSTVWGTTNVVQATTAPGCLLIPPPAPGNLTVAGASPTSATLTWLVTAAPGCSFSYEILRAPGASGGIFAQVGTATGSSFTDTGLTPNTTYRYQARTRDAAGNLSAVSNTVTATTVINTSGCAAAYRIVSAWGGAFQGEVTVTNTGNNPINGWRVTLTLSGAASISQIWGGRTSQTASPYTVANETWNGVLGPTATATFGFNANVAGSIGANGTVSCAAG